MNGPGRSDETSLSKLEAIGKRSVLDDIPGGPPTLAEVVVSPAA